MKQAFYLIFFLLFFSTKNIHADTISNVIINGNKRISNETILNTIQYKKNKKYSASEINDFQKKLFETNFFENVALSIKNKKLVISVKENPIIDFFYLKGVINKEREDFFYDNLNLGQNKIFTEGLLKNDIEKIKATYVEAGFFDVDVVPKISRLDGNALNVILEVTRNEKFKIKRIYFIGDKFFSSSELSDVISSSEHGWWKFFSNSTIINQARLEYDENLLKNFYLNEGFVDVQLNSSNVDIINEKQGSLTFSINSGTRYKFSNFKIIDNENILTTKHKDYITKIYIDEVNKFYSQKKLKELEDKTLDYLNNDRVEFVDFNLKKKKVKDNLIDIDIVFTKTKRNFVNLISVKGNSITEESVIRRNLVFSEGDTFAQHKLERSIDNLKSTGIFKDINTEIKNSGNELVDLNIKVEEQATGSISAGVGVGSSSSAITTGIQEKNLFGKGIIVNSNLSLGTDKISGSVYTVLPDYNNTGNKLANDLYIIRTNYKNTGYKSTVAGNAASYQYPLFEEVSLKLGAGIDRDKISTSTSASELYKKREGSYITLKTFYNVDSDQRNKKFKPTDGYIVGFGQAFALPGSDIPHLGNDIYGSYYKSMSKEFTFNLKAGASSITGLDNKDVKLSDRKFLTNKKLRGFKSRGVGPKDGKDHVGGNYSAYTSAQTTFPNPLPDKWNADTVLFLDAGNVWGVDYDSSKDKDKIRSSAGITLDWISPLGPLSFVFAETISQATGDKEESFSFNIGSSF